MECCNRAGADPVDHCGLCLLRSAGSDERCRGRPALVSEYWTENSEAAASLNDYLTAVTDEASPDYIPVRDRVAVFDLDGTLMCETYPFCFEYMVFADYALNSDSDTVTDDVRAVAQEIVDAMGGEKPRGMSTRQAAAGAVAYKGMTMKELTGIVDAFKDSEAWGFAGMTRGEAISGRWWSCSTRCLRMTSQPTSLRPPSATSCGN